MQTLKNKSVHPIINRISKESRKQLNQAENYFSGFSTSLDNLETFDFEYHLGLLRNYSSSLKKN